jgi:hypothetical protein
VERAMYVQRVARHLGITEDAILERIRSGLTQRHGRPQTLQTTPLSPEEVLLALLLRHPALRKDFRNYPHSLFSGALEREIFGRWLRDEEFLLTGTDDDPVVIRARTLDARRLPPLTEAEARRAANDKMHEILRDRIVLHQAARSEEMADAERTFGANRVAELAMATWSGRMPTEEDRTLAEAVIEEFQLGLSIHRREGPGGT